MYTHEIEARHRNWKVDDDDITLTLILMSTAREARKRTRQRPRQVWLAIDHPKKPRISSIGVPSSLEAMLRPFLSHEQGDLVVIKPEEHNSSTELQSHIGAICMPRHD